MKRGIITILLALFMLSTYAALPDVTLKDINGKEVKIADLSRSGKPIIISFFATWCKPCMVNGFGWEYKVLLDPNGTFKRAMNVQNIPHLFVIDSKGKTVYNHVGYTDGGETEIEKYLR